MAEIEALARGSSDFEQFIERAVHLIGERFGFYFVSLFLLDKDGEWIRLRVGTGEIGSNLRERGHRLHISARSMLGSVVRLNEALIGSTSEGQWRHPLLPDTKSKLLLPLRVPHGAIGVLDLHSDVESEFDEEDIPVFLPLAEQVARLCIQLGD